MSHQTYVAIISALFGGILISLVVAVAFFVMAAVGWRGPKRRGRLIRGTLFLLLAAILYAAGQAVAHLIFLPSFGRERYEAVRAWRSATDPSDAGIAEVGETAPDFTARLDNGSSVELNALRGKVVVLNFFASNCGPCVLEMPHIERIREKYRSRDDLFILAVGRGETLDTVRQFKAAHGLTMPMAVDEDAAIFGLHASAGIPRTYVISKDGKITFQSLGFWDADDYHDDVMSLEQSIANALSE